MDKMKSQLNLKSLAQTPYWVPAETFYFNFPL